MGFDSIMIWVGLRCLTGWGGLLKSEGQARLFLVHAQAYSTIQRYICCCGIPSNSEPRGK